MSADYGARLEQGRERTPSAQVVDAICRAFRLTSDAREHAFRLAKLSPQVGRDGETVGAELLQTMEAFPHAAAYVTNPAFRVLIANPAASALITPLQRRDSNVLAAIFLDPFAREFDSRVTPLHEGVTVRIGAKSLVEESRPSDARKCLLNMA